MPEHRVQSDDGVEFGSESFLDVIANIAGILIILIVVAGLRVKSLPPSIDPQVEAMARRTVPEASEAHVQSAADEREAIHEENRRAREKAEIAWENHRRELDRRKQSQRLQEKRAADQAAAIARRRQEIIEANQRQMELDEIARVWDSQADALAAELEDRRRQSTTLSVENLQLAARTAEADRLEQNADFWRKHAESLQKDKAALEAEIENKRRQLDELEKSQGPVRQWVHRSSPISLPVSKKELHLRLEAGKLDRVPLDRLIDRVRIELSLRDDKNEAAFDGVTGPVDGFRLRYRFVKAIASLSEIMASGSQRLELVSFEVIPPSEGKRLGVAEALAPDSAFAALLKECPADRFAVTLWVYPESFGQAKDLQTRLHEEGYVVALRPLPAGVPISASPQGSASRGQ